MRGPFSLLRNAYYRLVSKIDRSLLKGWIARQFHRIYYDSGIDRKTWWLGAPVWKCPFDLWACQEIICETRPDVIIECGTAFGGSALFFASICDLLRHGRVITIDCQQKPGLPEHPRIQYVFGSSVDPAIVGRVRSGLTEQDRVTVILDSSHRREHVLQEMRIYGPLVTPGNYLIVEDSNINGHPVLPSFGPGPMEAIKEFLRENQSFAVDREREKFLMTYNPLGYLRRKSEARNPKSETNSNIEIPMSQT